MKKRVKRRRRGRRRRRGGRKRRAGGGEMRRRMPCPILPISQHFRDHFSKYYKTKISILFWNFSPHLKIPIRITLRWALVSAEIGRNSLLLISLGLLPSSPVFFWY
jgi:hypothetical protein